MSVYIRARPDGIVDKVLLPGDPLRTKCIVETFLESPIRYNQVRGMLGYTGAYREQHVSIRGTGMGTSSADIYAHELINSYNVKKLIRVDACGFISEKINVRELVIAQAVAIPSSVTRNDFHKYDFPQIANLDLLLRSYEIAEARGFTTHVGNVLSDDVFYKDSLDDVFRLSRYGVLAVEMEAVVLYYLTAKFGVGTLTIMTVSGSLVAGEETTTEKRRATSNEVIKVGLETAITNQKKYLDDYFHSSVSLI